MSEVDLWCSRPIKNNYYSTERVDFGDPNVFYLVYICVSFHASTWFSPILTKIPRVPAQAVMFVCFFLSIHSFIHASTLSLVMIGAMATLHRYYTIIFLFVSLSVAVNQ